MKKLLLCLIFSLNTFAIDFSECQIEAQEYGGINKINDECFDSILSMSSTQNRVSKKEGNIFAVAHENIIVLKSNINLKLKIEKEDAASFKPYLYKIAGNKTTINKISSVALSSQLTKIAVLNESSDGEKEILIFSSYRSGNFSPLKIIKLKGLAKKPVKIEFDSDDLYILDGNQGRIIVVSSLSDSRNPDKSKKPKLLKEIELNGLSNLDVVSFSLSDEYLLLGDRSSAQIIFVDKSCSGQCEFLDKFTDHILESCNLENVNLVNQEITLTNTCGQRSVRHLN